MVAPKICKRCKKTESPEWWKCCPDHCTEKEPDVVCRDCKNVLHPICCAMGIIGFGIQPLCGWAKGHDGRHTWEGENIDNDVTEGPPVGGMKEKAHGKRRGGDPAL